MEAPVDPVRPESDAPSRPSGVTTDADGRFTLVLPVGSWRLVASARPNDTLLEGRLDLGEVDASRDDLVIRLEPVARKRG